MGQPFIILLTREAFQLQLLFYNLDRHLFLRKNAPLSISMHLQAKFYLHKFLSFHPL